MATKVYLALKNSKYKVLINELKSNTTSDAVMFLSDSLHTAEQKRNKFINDWLFNRKNDYSDAWKSVFEDDKDDILTTVVNFKSEKDCTFTLDLTSKTQFGLNKRAAMQADFCIIYDSNEANDKFKYTFWNGSLDSSTGNYTNLQYSFEIDKYMTFLPFDELFKRNVKIATARGYSNDALGYGSTLSFSEDLSFDERFMVPYAIHGDNSTQYKAVVFLDFGWGNDHFTIYESQDLLNWNTVSSIDWSSKTLTYYYLRWKKPIYYENIDDKGQKSNPTYLNIESAMFSNKDPKGYPYLDVLDADYSISKNVIALAFSPSTTKTDNHNVDDNSMQKISSYGIPLDILKSEYLLGIQLIPLGDNDFLSDNHVLNGITSSSFGTNSVTMHPQVDGVYFHNDAIDPNNNYSMSCEVLAYENIPVQIQVDAFTPSSNSKNYQYNKLETSQFTKHLIKMGEQTWEVKAEFASNGIFDSQLKLHFNGMYYLTPQGTNGWFALGDNNSYYSIDDPRANIDRMFHWAIDNKISFVSAASQSKLQNFNQLNTQANINDRNSRLAKATGALSIIGGVAGAAAGFTSLAVGGAVGGEFAAGAGQVDAGLGKSIMAGVNQIAQENDAINKQKSSLKDSSNSVDSFNTGTNSGQELMSNGLYVVEMTLAHPFDSLVKDYFKIYGYNLGGKLYLLSKLINCRDGYVVIKAADGGQLYQALSEFISPNIAKAIVADFTEGIRLWNCDGNWQYIGDYDSPNNIILDDGTKIDDPYYQN